ncbi:MAG: carbamoyl-phosphate synthase large subunit [Planctomycetes bacterium]|nr:carbamoyl-phosphate synthase large subunit [Planctomycetota bacterium]
MPKRTDIHKILLIGSGPIIIGQACEFDYSGTQACKALREEGYQVILINSNPATIMTDPEMAHRVYIEPVVPEVVDKVCRLERPDALLPTLGGQTGLNVAMECAERGILEEHGVEMIGASREAIHKAEDRLAFKQAMIHIGLGVPRSGVAHSLDEARKMLAAVGLPCIIRPAYTLGGTGSGIAYNQDEFDRIAAYGMECSRVHEVLIEESVIGWKEFELEVMRDKKDNVVIICSIENFDPMGVHTGDSITVAPAQTLTDKEYQRMRDAAIAVMREIGVETGGSNIQFAVNPEDGRMVVIEMNPRVSRSSALASKATGFPIAKFAAKLAIGYTLDEIPNDITRETPASFEPTIDYCVVKIPRFTFEKFSTADPTLTSQMKSVGETMSIGRTFKEALQKAVRGLEIGRHGLGLDRKDALLNGSGLPDREEIRQKLITPTAERLFYLRYAFKAGLSVTEVSDLSRIDPWFLENLKEIVDYEDTLGNYSRLEDVPAEVLREAKRLGFSEHQLAAVWKARPAQVRERRKSLGIAATYKLVDTCAAEFEAYTPYYYSTYEQEDESRVSRRRKIMILGGGPNRIGQGIEFDYCCCHAAFALREIGCETLMVNSNPETVSTDYDTSDQLFFEPVTLEDVLNIYDRLKPDGVIVQYGGQTPLNLAQGLEEAGVPIIGTSPDSIGRASDRDRFRSLLQELGLRQPRNGVATDRDGALRVAREIGYPIVVRPSFVLGGRAMEIVYTDEELSRFVAYAVEASPEHPILIDRFLENAIEVDVDAVADGRKVVIAGIMEHIEEAGIHSGDSACVLPPFSLSDTIVEDLRQQTRALGMELQVRGLMNVQYAIQDSRIYVLEVNPRASRTVPFVSKATGVPWAKIAAKVMAGMTLDELAAEEVEIHYQAVKESVFPFNRFPGIDVILGPEMKSTGEVMGIDSDLGIAFAKSQIAAFQQVPLEGRVFISVKEADKRNVVWVAKKLEDLGFELVATSGTHKALSRNGIRVKKIHKIQEGRPHVVDMMKNKEIHLVINTPSRRGAAAAEAHLRSFAVLSQIPICTTLFGAQAMVNAIQSLKRQDYQVKSLQEYHASRARKSSDELARV